LLGVLVFAFRVALCACNSAVTKRIPNYKDPSEKVTKSVALLMQP